MSRSGEDILIFCTAAVSMNDLSDHNHTEEATTSGDGVQCAMLLRTLRDAVSTVTMLRYLPAVAALSTFADIVAVISSYFVEFASRI